MLNWDNVWRKKALLLAIACLVFTAGCSESSPDQSERAFPDVLCEIYTDAMQAHDASGEDAPVSIGSVNNTIMKELGEYYTKHHFNIMYADPREQYPLIQGVVMAETGQPWECKDAERFFQLLTEALNQPI